MDEPQRRTPTELLSWRIEQLEIIERALRTEVHELRSEVRSSLREDYLTEAQMRNVFVTRDELRHQANVRREWPVIIATVMMMATSIANMILIATGGH